MPAKKAPGEFDMGIGHQVIGCSENEPRNHDGHEREQALHHWREGIALEHALHSVTHEDGDTSRAHHEHGQEHEQCTVVGDLALKGALGGHTPHVVETVLYAAHERNECPQQEYEANTDEDAL